MKAKTLRRQVLSILLVLCIIMGMVPTMAMAAEEEDVPPNPATASLQAEIDNLPVEGGVVYVRGNTELSHTLVIPAGKQVTLSGSEDENGNFPILTPGDNFQGGELIKIKGDTSTQVSIDRLTLDGGKRCRGICLEDNGRLLLGGSITPGEQYRLQIKNCYTPGGEHGAGLRAGANSHVLALNVLFEGNVAEKNGASVGGGAYLGDASGQFTGCEFKGNEAHSGAGVYFYGGVESSVLLLRNSTFTNNIADQRGGAVLCHGYGAMEECTLSNNHSGQYGGAVYISAFATAQEVSGKLLLQNTVVTNNEAKSNGGGVFIANNGTLFLDGEESTVIENKVEDGAPKPHDNNIFYNGSNSKIVVTSKTDKMGISTSNPKDRKLAVYSAATASSDLADAAIKINKRLETSGFRWDENTSYTMAQDPNEYTQFRYDGQAWRLGIYPDRNHENNPSIKALFDPKYETDSTGINENHQPGNMWLVMDQNDGSTDPHVIFDLNLPGAPLDVRSYAKGTRLQKPDTWPSLPAVGEVKRPGGATFEFLGWFTDPSEGRKVDPDTETITVTGDVVYYGHWKVTDDPVPVVGDMYLVYFDQNYEGGGFTASYKVAGTFTIYVSSKDGPQPVTVYIPWGMPNDPYRYGYEFNGWSLSQKGAAIPGGWYPTEPTTTLYAQWSAKPYNLTWKANEGTGGCTTTQAYDETVKPPTTPPTRSGYEFTGWYLDEFCTIPLTSGTLVRGNATFYAGWTPKEYTITWDAGYTGGTITTVKQHHDEKLNILPIPTRDGYVFGGWYTGSTKAESYGKVREDVTFTARWTNIAQTYTVTVEWDDQSNNDNVRPEEITVALLANGIPTGLSYTLDASDADTTGNKWSYTFGGLDVTDAVSNPITYSVAITSTVSDEYNYGIENKSAELGYILMTHSLITTDINSYVVWEDDSNNDGYRPSTVNLQLFANGKKVEDAEGRLSISGSGDTWTYSFKGFQKYYTDDAGNKGQEIRYTLEAKPTNPGELDQYTISYHNYTVILSHKKDTVSRTVNVVWQDNNNQDGKRPVNMTVQLYADNVPLEGKTVTLSDANEWTHTWNGLDKYTDGGREVVYSTRVISTLVDYTAASMGMTIEMTYVPSSTSISAFVTWVDEDDADGLRPEYIIAELLADGKPTGATQMLSATNGWTANWVDFPIYKDGKRIEYKFQIQVPDGYKATYHGVYDTTGLSAALTHERLKQDLTGNIVWEDRNNQSGGRLAEVTVLLYADGSVIDEDDRVVISAATNWEHIFKDLPIYRDHGQEIKYSMVLVSDPRGYVPTTNKMTITMNLNPEFVDIPFQVIWDDHNDSDGKRPNDVKVVLLVNGHPSDRTQFVTADTDWATTFTHLDHSGPTGVYRYRVELAAVPEGYAVEYSDSAAVLRRVAETRDVTATVIWQDNNDQYGQRPQQVTLTLYADNLDGYGPQNTGRVEKCKAAEGWTFTFKGVSLLHNGKRIIYSVKASGDLENYTMLEDGMDVYMKHKSHAPSDVTTEYTAKVIWHNNYHHNPKKPTEVSLVLRDNLGTAHERTVTKANADSTGYTWWYTFSNLPTYQGSKPLTYAVDVITPEHYTAQILGQTIILTQVKDIPVRVDWDDAGCDLKVRPESLKLYLRANGSDTDTVITMQKDDPDHKPWHNVFEELPVWVDGESEEPISYTWAFGQADLDAAGYTATYDYSEGVEEDGKTVYPITLSREGEEMEIPITIQWDDDEDRDGVRPETVKLNLYGKNTDISQAVTTSGNNTDESWSATSASVPTRYDHNEVHYSVTVTEATDKDGKDVLAQYTPDVTTEGEGTGQSIIVTMKHTPKVQPISVKLEWLDYTNDGGLTRFPVTVELVANDQTLKAETISAEQSTGKDSVTLNWTDVPVYYDHGKIYTDLAVKATAADKPSDYDITVNGFNITVERARYQVSGYVKDTNGRPISEASVTLIDAKNNIEGMVTTDSNGHYQFTTTRGTHAVLGYVVKEGVLSGRADFTILDTDAEANITVTRHLEWVVLSGEVKLSTGERAPRAHVTVSTDSEGEIGSVTALDDGRFSMFVLRRDVYHARAYYQGLASPSHPCGVGDGDYTNKVITIRVPQEGDSLGKVKGSISFTSGKSPEGMRVRCTGQFDWPNTEMVQEVQINADGTFEFENLLYDVYSMVLVDEDGKRTELNSSFTLAEEEMELPHITVKDSNNQDPTHPGAGTLSGVVLDKDGHPAQDAQIIVTDKANGDISAILSCGPDGAFKTTLAPGEYVVELWNPFDVSADLPMQVDDEAASKEDGPVTADSFTVSGFVLDEDGQPMEGVTVYLYGEDGQIVQLIATESNGEDPAPTESNEPKRDGDKPEAIAEALASEMVEVIEEVLLTKVDEVLAEANPAEEDEMAEDAASGPMEDIPGEDAPTEEDAAADLLAEDGFIRLDERVTTEDGQYVFAGLPTGQYVVKIARGIGGNGGSTDIPITVRPLSEVPDNADLTVTTDSYTVSDTVIDMDGKPVDGAKVTLLDADGNEVSKLTTGTDGAYAFDALPKGDYTVNISYPDSELLASGDVTITDGGFTAFPGQTVSGVVKDNKGNALPNVAVAISGEGDNTYTATTDKDGIYRVAVPDGKYTVEAMVSGKTASKAITVNGKAVTADLTITLSSSGGSGSGGGGGTTTPGGPGGGGGSGSGGTGGGSSSGGSGGMGGSSGGSASSGGSGSNTPPDNSGKMVRGYVNGYADGTFGGSKNITRSEVAALISRVSPDFNADQTYAFDFKDVSSDVWYAKNLGYCVEAGLIQGRGNGHFDPTANITRAEFAAIVARFLGLPNDVAGLKVPYTDTEDNWAEGYIAQLTAKGIVEGKGDGKFDPNANISRYEAVTMLNRALGRAPDKAVLDDLLGNLVIRAFPDLQPTHWAYYQVLEAAFDHYHK